MANEIIASGSQTQVAANINEFFGNIDFDKLSASIQTLANRQTNLSCIEKKSAGEVIDEWNKNVLEKIRVEENNITMFLSALAPTGYHVCSGISSLINAQMFIPELEFIIDKLDMRQQYEELEDVMTQYNAAEALLGNTQSIVKDVTTTVEDEILQAKDIELERIKKQAAVTKLGNKIAKLNIEIITAINADKDIIKSLKLLRRKSTDLKKAELKCSDVASLAKINVTIDDANIRDTLRDIINFSLN